MRTLLLLVVLLVPGLALADELPAALPPSYEAVYRRCQETRKAMVVWVNVKGRPVVGAVGLECGTFPGVKGAGLVVGVWRGQMLIRHDLPADATDAAITGLYLGIREEAGPPPPPVRVFTLGPPLRPSPICVGAT